MTQVIQQPGETANDFLQRWTREKSRPLRVLHIGNIANNAYNNAKIQRSVGIEADVACYDYYHVMGCPEWEDADFVGDIVNEFFPDWWNVDLNGFARPRWFVQGRYRTCQRYLLARGQGQRLRSALIWRRLRTERWLRCRSTVRATTLATLLGVVRGDLPPTKAAAVASLMKRFDRALIQGELRMRTFIWRARVWIVWNVRQVIATVRYIVLTAVRKLVSSVYALALLLRTGDWRTAGLTVFPRRLSRLARTQAQHELIARAIAAATPPQTSEIGRHLVDALGQLLDADDDVVEEAAEAIADAAGNAPMSADVEDVARAVLLDFTDAAGADAAAGAVKAILINDKWVLRYRALFPDRKTPLVHDDYATYLPTIDRWREICDHYDIVQGYSSDGIIPLLADVRTFTAYEHGTLREIPFEESSRGRICSLVFREAPAVFVTNSDVLPAARRLGMTQEQIVCLPHAVDSDKLLRFGAANAGLAPKRGETPILFSPSRHDWLANDPNLSKGNDRVLRALRIALDRGVVCRLVLVAWGRDHAASVGLVEDLDLEGVVDWVQPMKKRDLWKRYLGCHAVVDQFLTPAIGGVTFEAMALGRRVITSLDLETAQEFFGKAPAVFACETDGEIANAIEQVVGDPEDENGRGNALRCWFSTYHSAGRILDLQVEAYSRVLAAAEGEV